MSLVACEICGVEVPAELLDRHRALDDLDLRERRRLRAVRGRDGPGSSGRGSPIHRGTPPPVRGVEAGAASS